MLLCPRPLGERCAKWCARRECKRFLVECLLQEDPYFLLFFSGHVSICPYIDYISYVRLINSIIIMISPVIKTCTILQSSYSLPTQNLSYNMPTKFDTVPFMIIKLSYHKNFYYLLNFYSNTIFNGLIKIHYYYF